MNIIEELTLLRKAERVMGRIADGLLGTDREVLEAMVDAYANTILLLLESELPADVMRESEPADDLTTAYMAGYERVRDTLIPPPDPPQVTQCAETADQAPEPETIPEPYRTHTPPDDQDDPDDDPDGVEVDIDLDEPDAVLGVRNCNDLDALREALRRETGSQTPRKGLVTAIERRIRRLERAL